MLKLRINLSKFTDKHPKTRVSRETQFIKYSNIAHTISHHFIVMPVDKFQVLHNYMPTIFIVRMRSINWQFIRMYYLKLITIIEEEYSLFPSRKNGGRRDQYTIVPAHLTSR